MLAGGGGYSAITPAATVSMNQEKGAHCHNSSRVRMNNVLYYLASELELLADVTNI